MFILFGFSKPNQLICFDWNDLTVNASLTVKRQLVSSESFDRKIKCKLDVSFSFSLKVERFIQPILLINSVELKDSNTKEGCANSIIHSPLSSNEY